MYARRHSTCKILITPAEAEEWDGKSDISHQQLREVEIEDLLPRDKIEVDMDAIGEMLTNERDGMLQAHMRDLLPISQQ